MKKSILTLLMILFLFSLYSTIIFVPDDYSTIQLAVDNASYSDEIIVRDGLYEESITITTQNLTLRSENGYTNCIIQPAVNDEHCIENPCTKYVNTIEGFTFQNASQSAIFSEGYIFNLKSCCFINNQRTLIGGSAIHAYEPFQELSECIFKNNSGQYTVWIHVDYPLPVNPEVYEILRYNLFCENQNTEQQNIYLLNMSNNYHGSIENCTFVNGGISTSLAGGDVSYRNSIFSNSTLSTGVDITVSYSLFTNTGYQNTTNWGNGNLVSTNPLLCEATGMEGCLLEASPCIDAGDPTMTDSDGTRRDMGCKITTTDAKLITGNHWTWTSFPRLARTADSWVEAPPVLDDFLDWPLAELAVLHYNDENEPALEYAEESWSPQLYEIRSSLGYKLNTTVTGEHILPLSGSRLPANYILDYPLPENYGNWLGYWLPGSQNIEGAFGDFWPHVRKVWAEDWYFEKQDINRGLGQSIIPANATKGKNMTYGKMYIVQFDTPISAFHWTTSNDSEAPLDKTTTQSFTYTERADYQAIDVLDIPAGVTEIGVFEGDICVGAVVVENPNEQILVYSSQANRDPLPFNIQYVSGRGSAETLKQYLVWDASRNDFVQGEVFPGRHGYSLVKFGETAQPQSTPASSLSGCSCYPNPFNPSTRISFNLATQQPVTVEVFNMKGQKVKSLSNGTLNAGTHSLVWNGTDEQGNPVASGLYFYRIKTSEQDISGKMLLMK